MIRRVPFPRAQVALTALFAWLLALSLGFFATGARADVVIIYDETRSSVFSAMLGDQTDLQANSMTGTTATAELPNFSSITTSLFSNSIFAAIFDQVREGNANDNSFGFIQTRFSVTAPIYYSISGNFTNSAGTTGLEVELRNETSMSELFHNLQLDFGGATLSVGSSGANQTNELSGSMTGLLMPGNEYNFISYAYTEAPNFGDMGSEASGFIQIEFQSAAIPEPSSLTLLFGMGLTALIVRRRKGTSNF